LFSAVATAAAVFGLATVSACEDDPFGLNNWESNPDTATLYSLALDKLNLRSAFDFTARAPRPVEILDPSNPLAGYNSWDVVLDTRGGELVLLPAALLGVNEQARVVEFTNRDFDDVTEAPADTADYTNSAALTLSTTSTYVIRTRQVSIQSFFASTCIFYAKMQPVRLDPDAGVMEFLYDVNTAVSGCNNRRLIPPT